MHYVLHRQKTIQNVSIGSTQIEDYYSTQAIVITVQKTISKRPTTTERWVMDMQDANYALVYEPGRNDKDPLDFISRHPLPDTQKDTIEESVRYVAETEYAITMEHIQGETKTNELLQKLMKRIHKGDWEVHQHDPDIAPFFQVRSELYIVEDVAFDRTRLSSQESFSQCFEC
eukprot:gene17874-19653_t